MKFCNIEFNIKNKSDLFEYKDKLKIILTVNSALIVEANKTSRFFNVLNSNYVSFDGQIPYYVAKLLLGVKGFVKLSGSDIIYDFSEFAKKNDYKMFLLGGDHNSNLNAVKNIKSLFNIDVHGYSPPYEKYPCSHNFTCSCLDKINEIKPEILFIGFGTPKQEYWVEDNLKELSDSNIKYVICCGGTFDFVSKKIKRAPIMIQKIGFEGIYRLIQEPNIMRCKRIFYSLEFLKYILKKPDFLF
jgi:N-acetylglucosaminyldiphosphoundecaprenol N-acetyl-beta-D-mannosaminyltransferase